MGINLTNYHCHSIFCDGRADMKTMVRFAIAKGFSSFGFSSHAPLPFQTTWTMDKGDVSDYFTEFKRLRDIYKDRIALYIGLEIDYLDHRQNPSMKYFRDMPLDFRIGSVHLLSDLDGNFVDIDCSVERFREILFNHFNNHIDFMIRLYINNLMSMIELGGFDILGHCDKMFYNVDAVCPGKSSEGWVQRLMNHYFLKIAEKGYMVEINTKKYHELGTFFPREKYFPMLLELGIPVVVNSDAHYPDLINDGRFEALAALKKNGYETVRQLQDGVWRDVMIE